MISKMVLENWLCFRGIHELDFKQIAYAISAKRDDDPEYSNASGKTALLEAPGFALWSRHRWRLADDWISRGERSGGVTLWLYDGTKIARTRTIGAKSHKEDLSVTVHDGLRFIGDAAEAKILEIVGISESDFYATRHLEQKQISRFILQRPEERMSVVSAWVNLGPLERAEERARDLLTKTTELIESKQKLRAIYEDRIKHALGSFNTEGELLSARRDSEKTFVETSSALKEATDNRIRIQTDESYKIRLAEYEELLTKGAKYTEELSKIDGDKLEREAKVVVDRFDDQNSKHGMAKHRLNQLAGPARGEFDGTCPIADIECPARDHINKGRKEAKKKYVDAEKELDALGKNVAVLHETRDKAQIAVDLFNKAKSERARIIERAEKLQPTLSNCRQIDLSTTLEEMKFIEESAREKHNTAVSKQAHFTWAVQSVNDSKLLIAEVDEEIKALVLADQTSSAATLIFGRNGAQRRVAESALSQIETRANKALQLCGIELQVRVSWGREGTGIAMACDQCGHPFPTSARIKICSYCQAPRGPNLVHRLDIELSDSSGSLEDLAGVTVTMAAGGWLKDKRLASWDAVFIDEAWGSLDARHARALSSGLVRMLPEWGASQAFITAHRTSVLDALPGRIEVSRKGRWSEARVIG